MIIVERVNYYTMGGIVFPRKNDIERIQFNGLTKENYNSDLLSCLKNCTFIIKQIERLENIEFQIYKLK